MPVQAEKIGDVEQGAPVGTADDLGLTSDERAQWDAMQSAEVIPDDEPETAHEDAPEVAPEAAAKPEGESVEKPEGEDDGEEDAPEAPVDAKTGKSQQKQVSWQKHQRLLSARDAKLKAAEERANKLTIDQAKLATRLDMLNEVLTAPPPVDPVVAQKQAVAENPMLEPDIKVEDDALGAIAQLQRRNAYLLQQTTQTHEETQAQLQDRQLKDDFERDVAAYSRSEAGKHFYNAYQFLKDSRLTELAISLFDKDPTDEGQIFTQAEINKLVSDFNAEEKWVVSNARGAGKSAAAAIMKLAKGRGFKPQAPPAPSPVPAAAAPAAARPANGNGVPNAVAKIQAEAEAAAASRSLSEGGGVPPALELTQDRLLKMSDAEFGRFIDNLPQDQLDSIMGRPT